MEVNGYWQNGKYVQGATVRAPGTFSVGQLGLEVAAAVARARESGDALSELAELLKQHPQLRVDVPEQTWNSETGNWDGEFHLLTPLVKLYTEQLLKTPA